MLSAASCGAVACPVNRSALKASLGPEPRWPGLRTPSLQEGSEVLRTRQPAAPACSACFYIWASLMLSFVHEMLSQRQQKHMQLQCEDKTMQDQHQTTHVSLFSIRSEPVAYLCLCTGRGKNHTQTLLHASLWRHKAVHAVRTAGTARLVMVLRCG